MSIFPRCVAVVDELLHTAISVVVVVAAVAVTVAFVGAGRGRVHLENTVCVGSSTV